MSEKKTTNKTKLVATGLMLAIGMITSIAAASFVGGINGINTVPINAAVNANIHIPIQPPNSVLNPVANPMAAGSHPVAPVGKPQLYMFTTLPDSVTMYCANNDCATVEGEGGQNYYYPIQVHVTDTKFASWKNVPVNVTIGGQCSNGTTVTLYSNQKNTDNNGDARFVDDLGWNIPCWNILSIYVTGINPRNANDLYFYTKVIRPEN